MIKFDRLKKKCSKCGYDDRGRVDQEEVFTCKKCKAKVLPQWPPIETIQKQLRQGSAWIEKSG